MGLYDSIKNIGSSLTGGAPAAPGGYPGGYIGSVLARNDAKADPLYGGMSEMPEDASTFGQSSTKSMETAYTPPSVNQPTDLASLGKRYDVAPSTGTPKADAAIAAAAGAATPPPQQGEKPESTRDKMLRQIAEATDKLGTKADRTATIAQEQGLADKRARLTQLNDRYNQVNDQYERKIERLMEQNPEGQLLPNIQDEVAKIRRQQSSELGRIAIDQLAAQGAVTDAQDMVKLLVEAEFEPLEQQIQASANFLQLYGDDLTESEKMQLQASIDRKQYEYESGVTSAVASQEAEAFLKVYQEQGIDAVPKESQAAVLALANQRNVPSAVELATSEKSQGILDEITRLDELMGEGTFAVGPGIQRALGAIGGFFGAQGPANVTASMERLQALLSLDAIKAFKGLGPMSEREFAAAAASASTLRKDMSEEEFRAEVSRIQEHVENALLPLPSTPEDRKYEILTRRAKSQNPDTTPDEIDALVEQSYNVLVGNSQGSDNVPQRNNNPGNIKAGGLADDLAVGTDDQGHLIFASPEDGVKALTMDLRAKVDGKSRGLPANPTIAQLGSVYAEDPNWPNAVASMLGVSPDTKTKSVSFDSLANAIMRQEGYFA